MKKLFSLLFIMLVLLINPLTISAAQSEPETSAPSVLLMDADTGTILYAKDETTERPLASVTKVMTLLLIFEAIDSEQISLNDSVTVSEHAAGMGGSQVYLEANETQTVETMIKCIVIASANDASVAMAEFICGSEEAFVEQMNAKASALGMEHTHFVNACGLDADGHYSCALDIALMSRELTVNHPEIFDYTSIWMEDITHHTAKGDSVFTLSSTNKLLRQYEYATGLKTGSTSQAKFCLAATATRNDVNLIASIMAADDSASRISDAISLFEWGFSNCRVYTDENTDILADIPVTGGTDNSLSLQYSGSFRYLDTTGSAEELDKAFSLPESLEAPITEGDSIGKAIYTLGETKVGEIDIIAAESIPERTLKDAVRQMFQLLFFGTTASQQISDGPSF
ncbi:MAG: D-alanyl-D-alanine carboxypeptidase [Clostridiales bacterium]|nr:D-alanyl-D-alanine carboxypeptidase [Clostridiales bacterium]